MVDYAFYHGVYLGGSIPEAEFPRFARRAEEQLEHYRGIYAVAAGTEDGEALAQCAMAEVFAFFDRAEQGRGAVTTAYVGNVYTSRQAPKADLTARGQSEQLYRAASRYLTFRRGVSAC